MEKPSPAFVVDLGSSECRFGFSDAPSPLCLDPCVARRPRYASGSATGSGSGSGSGSGASMRPRSPFDPTSGLLVNFDILEDVFDTAFLSLGVGSSPTRFVATEHMCSPVVSRIALIELLHETYGAEEVATGIDALFALQDLSPGYAERAPDKTAAVLNISHSATHVLPLAREESRIPYPDFSRASRCPVGMLELGRHMQLLLHAKYSDAPFFASETFSLECVRQHCFVAENYPAAVRRYILPPDDSEEDQDAEVVLIDMQVPYAALHPSLPPGAERVKLLPAEDEAYRSDPVEFLRKTAREQRELAQSYGNSNSSGRGGTGGLNGISIGPTGSSSERRRAEAQQRMRQITTFLDASDETKRTAEELDEEVWQWNQANQPVTLSKEDEAATARLSRLDQILTEYDPHGYFKRNEATASIKYTTTLARSMTYGYKMPRTLDDVDTQLSTIRLTTERVRVPEALFAPSLMGIDSAGVAELLAGADDIYVVGGGSLIPGLCSRLCSELTPYSLLCESNRELNVTVPSLDSIATQAAWRGAAQIVNERPGDLIWSSRTNFLEIGGDRTLALLRKSHQWANS